MLQWLKELFSKWLRAFKAFMAVVFTAATKIIIAKLKDIAIEIIKELASTDLSNEEKRTEAFSRLKDYSFKQGIVVTDSLINLIIEMAVQAFKNEG